MRHLAFMGVMLALAANWAPQQHQVAPVSNSTISGWRAKNWGLLNSRGKSHVDAPAAWDLLTSARRPMVAVVDTGVSKNHAIVESVSKYGYSFASPMSHTPDDFHGHGTHVSGIILAVSDFHALILPLKYYDDQNTGPQNLRGTIDSFNFAIDHGAKIINYSGGGPEFSEYEYLALKRAEKLGILVVVAAGNDHHNTDLPENRYFPAGYRLSNMISVASADINNNLLASSNWGVGTVDVAAPGENIYSTLPGDRFGYMSGTSQATAFVSGIAAMMLSENPQLKAKDLKALIERTIDHYPQQVGKVKTGGRVNAYAAVKAAKSFTRGAE